MGRKEEINLLEAREKLDDLIALLETCIAALTNKENGDYTTQQVGTTLHFIALPVIEQIKKYCGE